HDDIGKRPPGLLRDLEAQRLLPLDPVWLLQRGGVEPAVLGAGLLHHRSRVGYRAIDEVHARAVRRRLTLDDLGRGRGHHDDDPEPGASPVCGPGRAGVAGRREGDRRRAELAGARHADGRAARLERACRQEALVLDEEAMQAERLAERVRLDDRGVPLPEGHRVVRIVHRQQLAVAPEGRLPAGEHGARDGPQSLEVVAHEVRAAVDRTQVRELRGVPGGATPSALEVRDEGSRWNVRRLGRAHATRSIFAPSPRRRPSTSSYPRSICSMLWMTLVPFAASAAPSNARPARMSGLWSSVPNSCVGPMITARWGSASTSRAPIVSSAPSQNIRFSYIHSWMSTVPSACVANA